MPELGKRSKKHLLTAHPDLQRLFEEVIKFVDFSVLEGHRGKEAQDKAVAEGNSETPWPEGKHNKTPSLAVDVAPYPVDFNDTKRFYMFVGFVRGIAASMNIPIRCGADWNGNFEVKDQTFHDLPHFELIDKP